jgi:predicted nucleic acid-binding protein
MLVIADSSPFILLSNIGHINVLPVLFQSVTIPPEVAAEVAKLTRPRALQEFMANKPAWLVIKSPTAIENIPLLDVGERAAISLATELGADLLLIDEIRGRKAAAERKITFTGTIGVLERAAEAKLLDLKEIFERIKKTDFWISHKILDERLKLYERRANK